MDQIGKFKQETLDRIKKQGTSAELASATKQFLYESIKSGYSYNFSWMGRPIIQYPQDVMGMQELIWEVKPDLIIECGIAHGGSLIFSASMLALLDYCDALDNNEIINPLNSKRKVLGIDIDIREHNKAEINKHALSNMIFMIQGSSIDSNIITEVHDFASSFEKILICLDSNHSHAHVLEELKAYAPLTSINSYCVVFDTVVEDLPADQCNNRPWGKGDNPKTAVYEFLTTHNEFEIDFEIQNKLLITVAPDGYLKRVK